MKNNSKYPKVLGLQIDGVEVETGLVAHRFPSQIIKDKGFLMC